MRIISGLALSLILLGTNANAQPDFSQAPANLVCQMALGLGWLTSTQPQWDFSPRYAKYISEARQRGYSPAYCVALLTGRPSPSDGASTPAPATTTPPPPSPDPLVVSVQTLLDVLGYDVGPADGFAGSKTAAAISAFQQSVGEKPDGRSSEALRASLQKALAERGPGSAPKQPDKPRDGSKGDTKLVSTGTGFFIAGDIIITNNHVVEGCKEIRVAKRGAEIGGARSIATNRGDDLAALRADKASENYLKLRIGVPVKAAEPVLVFGYPLSVVLSSSGNTTLGNVTALAGLKDDSRYMQISAAVQPGNSGGPVLDEAGRLVGVIEGKLDALKVARVTGDIPQNVNFAIRTSTLVNFLEANRIAYEVASSSATLPNTQLAEQAEAASVQLECRK